jgi:aspartate/methionine/tyrosine aminotransferase
MCIGEPDFPTPERVCKAAFDASLRGETHYTMPLGIPPLRAAISSHYQDRYHTVVPADRIAVTVGGSAALMLAFGAFANPGDQILMADPGYPSNRACLTFCGADAVLVPVDASTRFQLTPELVESHWTPRTKGVMIASPANPTGTSIPFEDLKAIHGIVQARGGVLLVDEIYHGLTYGHRPPTACSLGDDVFVMNSFSKYYCMTGWRVGWLVVPPQFASAVERMQAHFYICPPAPSQWAALAAFDPECAVIFDRQRDELQRRRDFLVPALRALGLTIEAIPDGAFYTYADITRFSSDSWELAWALLQQTGIAVTPGRDFGVHRAHEHVRISYTASMTDLQDAVAKMETFLKAYR